MSPMIRRILIVSASVGAGHTQAAAAIAEEMRRRLPNASVYHVDFMAGQNSYLNHFLKETYLTLLEFSPAMYDRLYRWSHESAKGGNVQGLVARMMKRDMRQLVLDYQPDLVVTTHPFPCAAAACLKRAGEMKVPLAGVVTDFTIHRMWAYPEVDLYFVAQPELAQGLTNQGIARARIHVTGIPISAAFTAQVMGDQEFTAVSKRLRILVMGGGLGLGGLEKAAEALEQVKIPLDIVILAGRNASVRRELIKKGQQSRHKVQVLGYTRQIPDLMKRADLLLTKPGALTISEALSSGLPLVLYKALPGQEQENAEYLVRRQAGIWVTRDEELGKVISNILTDPKKLQLLRERGQVMARPHAAAEVVSVLSRLITSESAAVGL